MTSKVEALYDAVVECDTVAAVVGLECLNEDQVAVGVVREYDGVVAAARADGGAAHAVSVELADGLNDDEQFLGALGQELTGDVGEGNLGSRLGFGISGALL